MSIDRLRYAAGFRAKVNNQIPFYTLNEIDPAMGMVPTEYQVGDGMVVFDVGANTGVWSAALLQHSGRFIRELHQFEPMPGNVGEIERNRKAGLYGPFAERAHLHQVAASDRTGPLTLRWDEEVTGYASASVISTLIGTREVALPQESTVSSITLDGFAAEHDIERVHFLKIDVEGYEMAVLKGAQGLLEKGRVEVILYEFGTHQMGRRELFRDFWDFFEALDYEQRTIMPNGWGSRPIERYSAAYEDMTKVRLLLAHPRRDDRTDA